MHMAASLGLSHETAYSTAYQLSSSSSYFPDPLLFTDSCAAALDFDAAVVPPSGYYSPPPALFPGAGAAEIDANMSCNGVDGGGRRTMGGDGRGRIGFRTRSEVDVLDDGFKWRKYGKKAVKSSPNPRNYYRCSSEGCGVKKRVERDCGDPRYVVTTYDGVHNHAAPGAACLAHSPPAWSSPAAAAAGLAAPVATSAWRPPVQSSHPAVAAYSSESSY